MKTHFKQELLQAAKNYLNVVDGNARLSLIMIGQKDLFEVNFDKIDNKITITTVTGGDEKCLKD